jgi:hypothetical protein
VPMVVITNKLAERRDRVLKLAQQAPTEAVRISISKGRMDAISTPMAPSWLTMRKRWRT